MAFLLAAAVPGLNGTASAQTGIARAGAEAGAGSQGGSEDMVTGLSPLQLRALARDRLARGDMAMARTLAQALLARDPDDLQALLVLAQAERALGGEAAALEAARRAWALSETDEERYASALIRAQVLSSAGRRTLAQLWLRRAAEVAPDAATRARAIRDFRYLRLRNPWSSQLSLAVTPTDNVNNGSSQDSFTIDGLPWDFILSGEARALSGVELSLGADTRYRLSETEDRATDLMLRASHRTYALSAGAEARAPGAEGSDFAYSTLSAGIGQRRLLGDLTGGARTAHELSYAAWAGQNWYGGDPYGGFLRGEARLAHRLDARNRLSTGLTLEARRGDGAPEADVQGLSLGWDHGWSGGQLSLYGVVTLSQSGHETADYRDLRLGARIAPKAGWMQETLGARPSLTLEARERRFDRSSYSFDGRSDAELSASLEVTFGRVDYYGFSPVVTLETSRTRSNVDLFDTGRTGLGLSVQSAF